MSHSPVGERSRDGSSRQLISYLEQWAVLRLLRVYGARLRDSTLHLSEDNQGVPSWMMKSVVMLCYIHNIVLVP